MRDHPDYSRGAEHASHIHQHYPHLRKPFRGERIPATDYIYLRGVMERPCHKRYWQGFCDRMADLGITECRGEHIGERTNT